MAKDERKKPAMLRAMVVEPDGTRKLQTIREDAITGSVTTRTELTAAQVERAKALYQRVGRYLPFTPKEFVQTFYKERNPEQEMTVYDCIADATDELWVDDMTGELGLDRKAVIRVLLMVSLGTVDIPSQMDGITDEYVAKAKELYNRQIERRD